MEHVEVQNLAERLQRARANAAPLEQISSSVKDFSSDDAYSIQEEGIRIRTTSGENIVGMKMGLTSKAKREQMSLDSPLYGVLTDKMKVENGGTLSLTGLIHPKVEPEVAFFVEREIEGIPTREEVLDSCSGMFACMEILDSRYEHFKYFSLQDVIADNSSSSHFVVGPKVKDFNQLDLKQLSMTMKINGEVATEGMSSAISGDPVISVIQLAELLSERGKNIDAGTIVLAGAATSAASLEVGMKIELLVEGLEPVSFNVGA